MKHCSTNHYAWKSNETQFWRDKYPLTIFMLHYCIVYMHDFFWLGAYYILFSNLSQDYPHELLPTRGLVSHNCPTIFLYCQFVNIIIDSSPTWEDLCPSIGSFGSQFIPFLILKISWSFLHLYRVYLWSRHNITIYYFRCISIHLLNIFATSMTFFAFGCFCL